MASTVYVIGAGANRAICDWQGNTPPLATDLFGIAAQIVPTTGCFRERKPAPDSSERFSLWPLFDYIKKYWRLEMNDLVRKPFDLEECFTLLQLQLSDAEEVENWQKWQDLNSVYISLTALLWQTLDHFSNSSTRSPIFEKFGELIYRERPTIISFNYDTYLEEAVEHASGQSDFLAGSEAHGHFGEHSRDEPIPDKIIRFSRHQWDRRLAYGTEFGEVMLDLAGGPPDVPGDLLYKQSEVQLYDRPILKLHGSLNWFRYFVFRKRAVILKLVVRQTTCFWLGGTCGWDFPKLTTAGLLTQ